MALGATCDVRILWLVRVLRRVGEVPTGWDGFGWGLRGEAGGGIIMGWVGTPGRRRRDLAERDGIPQNETGMGPPQGEI